MTQLILQAIAFVLFLIALPLLSFGTMQETEPLWMVGLALIAVAGLIPPILRFAPVGDEGGDEGDEDDGGGSGGGGDGDAGRPGKEPRHTDATR